MDYIAQFRVINPRQKQFVKRLLVMNILCCNLFEPGHVSKYFATELLNI